MEFAKGYGTGNRAEMLFGCRGYLQAIQGWPALCIREPVVPFFAVGQGEYLE